MSASASRAGLLAVMLLGPAACGSVRITLQAEAATNRGRPLQVLIRSTDEQTYRGESYAAAAKLVLRPDRSVLRQLVVDPRPRTSYSLRVKVPPGRALALYFLYTSPSAEWKMLLPPPLPWSITVPLRRGGIATEEVREKRGCSSNSAPPSLPSVPEAPSVPAAPSLPEAPSAPAAPSLPTAPSLPALPGAG